MESIWVKVLQHAPALAAMAIIVLAFLKYLKSRDERSEREHERFSEDLERVCKRFDASNTRLMKLVAERNGNA